MTQAKPHRILHTMIRVADLDKSVRFYTELLGMKISRRVDNEDGKFTLVFLGYGDESDTTVLELTHNWDERTYEQGTAYGHLALAVEDIQATCDDLKERGVTITREPGLLSFIPETIAFIEDPDGYKIELVEKK